MLHYWAIRQYDLRDLQATLASHGLSSLGRSEPHVEATLLRVRSAICAMLGMACRQPITPGARIDQGPELLRRRTQELLGPEPVDRVTRIMVTLPSSAATDPSLVRELVERGMNIARINCAHDDARGVALDGRARPARGRSDGPKVLGRDGSCWTKAAYRTTRTRSAHREAPTNPECARAGNRPGTGLAYRGRRPDRPTRSRHGVAAGIRRVAAPPPRWRRPPAT